MEERAKTLEFARYIDERRKAYRDSWVTVYDGIGIQCGDGISEKDKPNGKLLPCFCRNGKGGAV